jgi:hypothetical protein
MIMSAIVLSFAQTILFFVVSIVIVVMVLWVVLKLVQASIGCVITTIAGVVFLALILFVVNFLATH